MSRSSASIASRTNMSYRVRNLSFVSKPMIEINLDNTRGAHGDYVTSYSSMDKLQGVVRITPEKDTRFDDLEITFEGTAKTFVDKLSTAATVAGRTEATHRFLRLTQPIDESCLPQPRIAEAGRSYEFPFTFVVPDHMLPRSCSHRVTSEQVKAAHLRLPPSLGDPDVSGFGGTLLDDLAPEMAKISYAIKVRITKLRASDDSDVVVAEKSRKVRIKPAVEEDPPLSIDAHSTDYVMRQEKTIRKGLLKGKLGRLIMEAEQPQSLRLTPPGVIEPITTMAKVMLRFDPEESNSPPPRLGSLASKLKVSTFFSSTPRHTFPSKASTVASMSQGYHSLTVALSSRCVSSAQWTRHDGRTPPEVDRRRSTLSANSASSGEPLEPSESYTNGQPFYTAHILVPVTLPTNKSFVPTFHTCLISRIYSLNLSLSVHSPSLSSPSVTLKIPIQISQEGSAEGDQARRESQVHRATDEEVQRVFEPRSVAPPPAFDSAVGQGGHDDLPPGYQPFTGAAPGQGRVMVATIG